MRDEQSDTMTGRTGVCLQLVCWERGRRRPPWAGGATDFLGDRLERGPSRFALNAGEGARAPSIRVEDLTPFAVSLCSSFILPNSSLLLLTPLHLRPIFSSPNNKRIFAAKEIAGIIQ